MEGKKFKVDEESITELYEYMNDCVAVLRDHSEQISKMSEDLKAKEAQVIRNGVEGKNAKERESNLLGMFSGLRELLSRTERAYSKDKVNLELARMEVDRIKLIMRLRELVVSERS